MTRRSQLFLVAAAAFLVYANSLWNGFAYDDAWIVLRNTRVHQLGDWRSILLTPYWPSFGVELGLYRPFTILAFAFEWAIGGGAPWLFHLTNVLLHVAVSLLVFLLTERLFSQRVAIAASLVFALHPLHTEAVANVVGQGELWAALFALLACLLHCTRPPGPAVSWARRGLLLACYATALLFKEGAVVLPGLLLLLDVVQRRVQLQRASVLAYLRANAFLYVAAAAVLFAFLLLRLHVLGNITGTDAAPGLPHLREQYRVLNAFRAWPEFVRLLVFPLDLSVDYAPGVILPVQSVTAMVALGMLLVACALLLLLSTPSQPRAGLAAGWFLIAILPVSNFFFPIGVLIAERTLYLPSLAVCLAAGYAWEAVLRSAVPETRRLGSAAAMVILVSLGARTVVRNPDWDSLETVWKSLSRDHPESYRSQWTRAVELWAAGDVRTAEQHFLLANRIWGRDSQLLKEFGNFYIGQRRYRDAIPILERSRDMTAFVPQTWELLAYAYFYGGQPQQALETAWRAAAMPGTHRSLTYSLLGGAYYELGEFGKSAGAWRVVTQQKSGKLWLNYAMLARSLAAAGEPQAAQAAADTAFSNTNNQPSLQQVVTRLRTAIATGCYPQGVGCDPLEGWVIAAGRPPERAGI